MQRIERVANLFKIGLFEGLMLSVFRL